MIRQVGVVVVLLLAGAIVVTPQLAPCWAHRRGLDALLLPTAQTQVLDSELEISLRRIRAADALVAAVIEGRANLAEAAPALLALHESVPYFREDLRQRHPGETDVERASREVAARAYRETPDPAARERLAARLSAEFKSLYPASAPLAFQPVSPPAPPPPTTLGAPRPGGRALPKPLPGPD